MTPDELTVIETRAEEARIDVTTLIREVQRLTAEEANSYDLVDAIRRNLNAAGDEIAHLAAEVERLTKANAEIDRLEAEIRRMRP